jgi:hypothetical protein
LNIATEVGATEERYIASKKNDVECAALLKRTARMKDNARTMSGHLEITSDTVFRCIITMVE